MESPEVIVERTLPRLFNTACYLSGTRRDAEDAVQETILAYLERCRKDPSAVQDPMGWCLTVLTRTCHKRRRPRQELALSETQDVPHPEAGPEDQVLSEERRDLVMRAMATLPDTEQEAISLHVFGGLTVREAAAALEVPSSTCDWRIQKGMERLRGRLAPLSMAVSIAWLKELPPLPVPAGLAASLTASATVIAATGIGAGGLASSSLTSGGIAMSMFSGKAGLGVSAVLAAALVGSGIQVHLVKKENEALREKVAQTPKRTGTGASTQENAAPQPSPQAAPPSPEAAVPVPEVVPETKDPALPDVEALAAKAQAALQAKDAEALSDAVLALLDAGEPAYPALIGLIQEMGNKDNQKWLWDSEHRDATRRFHMAIQVRAPNLGGLMDAILVREGDPDKATEFALHLLSQGAQSFLPKEGLSALLRSMLRRGTASGSRESKQILSIVAGILLGKLKAKEALPEIEKCIIEDLDNNFFLPRSIGEMGGPEAVASLGRLLETVEDLGARQVIIAALTITNAAEANTLLLKLYEKETDERMRSQIMSALTYREKNVDRIAQQLRDPQLDKQQRSNLLSTLVLRMADSKKQEQAVWNLYESEPAMQDDLLDAMLDVHKPKAREILFQRLKSGQVTEKLLSHLQDMGQESLQEVAEPLRTLVISPATPVGIRLNALSGLYHADPEGALDTLMIGFNLLPENDRVQIVQTVGREILGEVKGQAALKGIAANDPSEAVRLMASQALMRSPMRSAP